MRVPEIPQAILARLPMLQGQTTMASATDEPLATGASRLSPA